MLKGEIIYIKGVEFYVKNVLSKFSNQDQIHLMELVWMDNLNVFKTSRPPFAIV